MFWQKRGGGQPFIALGSARAQVVPLPPIELQNEFADKASNYLKIYDCQKQSSEEIEKLFKVFLHRAFTGELTAKWREAHLKELLVEMEHQAKLLRTAANNN